MAQAVTNGNRPGPPITRAHHGGISSMTASILAFPVPAEAALSGIPDDELVCTITRAEDISPALFLAAVVVWVGWLADDVGPAVRRRRDLAAAVAAYLMAGARLPQPG